VLVILNVVCAIAFTVFGVLAVYEDIQNLLAPAA
jgi:choline-glycine betaine transporter